MPSRFARGSSTKASARLDALFRVMVRLSCMADQGTGGGVFAIADRGQAAGFGEGGIQRAMRPARRRHLRRRRFVGSASPSLVWPLEPFAAVLIDGGDGAVMALGFFRETGTAQIELTSTTTEQRAEDDDDLVHAGRLEFAAGRQVRSVASCPPAMAAGGSWRIFLSEARLAPLRRFQFRR